MLLLIEKKEVEYLDLMKEIDANRYMADWLQLDSDEYDRFIHVPRIDRINRYMDNFMEWKRSYGESELEQFIEDNY